MTQPISKHRGTIIIDACVLFDMCCSVEQEFRDPFKNKMGRFLDAVIMLSNNGFKIVIPEIVLYETGALLTNGKCISDYFPKKDSEKQKVRHHDLIRFLSTVIADQNHGSPHYPNIQIAPTSGPDDVKRFLDRLKEVTEKYSGACKDANFELVKIQKNKHDFGDLGIETLLDEMADDIQKGQVYLFTNDRSLAIRQGFNWKTLHLLDMSGFLKGICGSGLREELGIKRSCAWQDIMLSVHNQRANSMGKRWSHQHGYTDTSFGNAADIDYSNQDHSFSNELQGLAQSLRDERSHAETFAVHNKKPLTQLERYNARYGNKGNGTNGLGQ